MSFLKCLCICLCFLSIHVDAAGKRRPGMPRHHHHEVASKDVPFAFHVFSESDVYVRIQGIHPHTGNRCYVTFHGENPHYVDFGGDAGQFSIKLPPGSASLQLPQMLSGRIYFSVGSPLQWEDPDRDNPWSPDADTQWSMMEFTSDQTSVWANTSAVDGFFAPSIQIQMDTDRSNGLEIGYEGDPEEFIEAVRAHMRTFAPKSLWSGPTLLAHGGILSPKHSPEFDHYYDSYLQETFLDHYKRHSLYLQTGSGVLRGLVSRNGKKFHFYDKKGKRVTSLPTNSKNSKAWFTGATGDWCGNEPTTDVQKDLMRDLSALLNSGIRPGDTHTSWDRPIDIPFFQAAEKKGLFYLAKNKRGEPMYHVYARAMHMEYTGYAYDYDDLHGRDQTQSAAHSAHPSFSVNIHTGS